jgi:hypothetical protein
MKTLASVIQTFNLRHVGVCPTCVRISFRVMILSWVIVLNALALNLYAHPMMILVPSCGLTLLWSAHVITRALRSMPMQRLGDPSRRLAIRAFVKAAAGAAVMSVAATSRQARADSGCGGWAGNSGCGGPVGPCQRQTVDCRVYSCRSCGEGCTGNC